MNIEALETAITDKITSLGISARPHPGSPGNYKPSGPSGEVLVRYAGARHSPLSASGQRKECRQMIKLVFVASELRGPEGLYALMDRVREELEGFMLPGAAGPLEIEAEDFTDEYNDTWQFYQRWNINSKQEYEQQDDYADRPLSTGN